MHRRNLVATTCLSLFLLQQQQASSKATCPNAVDFFLRFDSWPWELSYEFSTDDELSTPIFGGDGVDAPSQSLINETACVPDGCYKLVMLDSFGDGVRSDGDYGWFTMFLNDKIISLGKQTFDDDQFEFRFCTQLFGWSDRLIVKPNNLTLVLYDMSFDLTIWSSRGQILLQTEYESLDFMTESIATDLLTIADGCFVVEIFNVRNDSSEFHAQILYNSVLVATVPSSFTSNFSFDTCNFTPFPTTSPTTGRPSLSPTDAPTRVDYVLNVLDATNASEALDAVSDTQMFGCDTNGCSVSRGWEIQGMCEVVTLSLSVVETDFDFTCYEFLEVFVNDEIVGECEGLGEAGCTHNWTDCADVWDLDVTHLLEWQESQNVANLELTLSASDNVTDCPYEWNNTLYRVFANAQVSCYQNASAVSAPRCSGEGGNYLLFSLTYDSWPEEVSFEVWDANITSRSLAGSGLCADEFETVTDNACIADGCYYLVLIDSYGDGLASDEDHGYYELYLNREMISLGKTTFHSNSTLFYFCTDLFGTEQQRNNLTLQAHDINFKLLVTESEQGTEQYYEEYEVIQSNTLATETITLYFNSDYCFILQIYDVWSFSEDFFLDVIWNGFPLRQHIVDYFEFSNCNATLAPIPAPTAAPTFVDYYLDVLDVADEFGIASDTQYFGCEEESCRIDKIWQVTGVCEALTLSVSVVETDFDLCNEFVEIFANNVKLGACGELDEDCTFDWVDCLGVTDHDVSYLLDSSSTSEYLGLSLRASQDVGQCEFFAVDDVNYFLYANATITCYPSYELFANASKIAKNTCDAHNLTFSIKYDAWPEEIHFEVLEESDNSVIHGSGGCSADYEAYAETACAAEGCYFIKLTDEYGDGMFSNADHGYFTVLLDGNDISLGKQTFRDNATLFRFCTQLFDTSDVDNANNLTLELYDISFKLLLTAADGSEPYFAEYEALGYQEDPVVVSLYLDRDYCFYLTMSEFEPASGYFDYKLIWNDEILAQAPQGVNSILQFTPCDESSITIPPVPMPTIAPTVVTAYINASEGVEASDSQLFGCEDAPCRAQATWQIDGVCEEAAVTLSVLQTDFASIMQEYVDVWINGEYLGPCDGPNQDCTEEFSFCSNVYNFDVTDQMDASRDYNYIEVTLISTEHVNYCAHCTNNYTCYYLFANASVSCLGGNRITSMAPSLQPSIPSAAPSKAPLQAQASPTSTIVEIVGTEAGAEQKTNKGDADGSEWVVYVVIACCLVCLLLVCVLYSQRRLRLAKEYEKVEEENVGHHAEGGTGQDDMGMGGLELVGTEANGGKDRKRGNDRTYTRIN